MKINSEFVKALRAKKNWSQEQLGDACGLSLRTIQRLENTGKASIDSVRALADVFEIEPSELMLAEADDVLTPLKVIKKCFLKFNDFSSTATRFEYWWFFLFVLLVAAIAVVVNQNLYQIVSLIVLIPLIAVGTRRLNDVGRSGWWQLLFLVPFGQVVIFYLLAQEGNTVSA